ncbi:MAG TPA: TIGR03790 family protein [Candidatus Limnocylindria bacterium]|jgi:uncharacterized protein (TIGR03790 family)|nr:TIGR03790 family protein [Candidatus Limnocylindria bacterium]
MNFRPQFLVALLCWWAGMGISSWAQEMRSEGSEVLVIYNSNSPDSKAVAEHYVEKRRVPGNQMIGLPLPDRENMSRAEYRDLIQEPLLQELPRRQLASWSTEVIPLDKDHAGGVKYRLTSSKFRYIVLCYGIPWIIANDPLLKEPQMDQVPVPLRRNEASVDSDLALLPLLGRLPITSAVPNPWQKITNALAFQPTNGAFMVSRLDGPSPALASALVDKAMEAEKIGLWGNAFFDLRGISSGSYQLGDTYITNAAVVARQLGFETYIDNVEATLPPEYPLNQVAIYMGWYSQNPVGPFTAPQVEFMPGAIAYHLHSFSGMQLHSPVENWVGPLIAKGATVTMGCVLEPYLGMTPDVGILMDRLARGFTFGEAALACQPVLSWQTIAVGDPLYRPFGRSLVSYAVEMHEREDVLSAFADVRKVNQDLAVGRSLDFLIDLLSKAPGATNNSIYAEKIARLYAEKSRLRNSVEWMQKALGAQCTLQQRTRMLLEMANWLDILDRPKEAMAAYENLVKLRPDYPAMLELRKRERTYAREAGDNAEMQRLDAEIARLSAPPPAPTAPTTNISPPTRK